MVQSLLPETRENGGLPEPPASEPIRIIAAHHDSCGADTHVRLPGSVPARAIRRLNCSSCAQPFAARAVQDHGLEEMAELERALAAVESGPSDEPMATPKPAKSKLALPKLTMPKLDGRSSECRR